MKNAIAQTTAGRRIKRLTIVRQRCGSGQATRVFHLKRHFQQMLKSKNNRETKPLTISDLKNIRNYLEKIKIKPQNGRVWIVLKGGKGFFVEPKC